MSKKLRLVERKPIIIRCFILLMAILLFAPAAHADLINVISQKYSVKGYASTYVDPDFHTLTISYEKTSSLPVSDEVYMNCGIPQDPNLTGQSWARSSANGGVTSGYAWLEVEAAADDDGWAQGYAFGSASMTFSPLVSTMLVSAAPEPWAIESSWIRLIDLTEDLTLYTYPYSSFSDSGWAEEKILMSFNPSHIYTISVEVEGLSGPNFNSSGSLSLNPVPEPSTLLLLGSGLLGLIGFRRKFRKS